MKKDDIVEIHEIHQFGPDRWRPAVVIAVIREEAFAVELLQGDFGKEGVNRKAFSMHGRGRQWR